MWDLADRLQSLHPSLRSLGKSIKFSVNLTVVDADATLKDGDEVGVLPPVAGG